MARYDGCVVGQGGQLVCFCMPEWFAIDLAEYDVV